MGRNGKLQQFAENTQPASKKMQEQFIETYKMKKKQNAGITG